MTENTVHFHMKNILAKLHSKNRTQAVAYAIRTGIVDLRGETTEPPYQDR